MKALVKRESKPGLTLEELPRPKPKLGEVLVKVHKAAICGTDVHIYKWDAWAQETIPLGLTVGHEFMGTIAEIGEGVQGLEIGQRVSAEGHLYCGRCRACQLGRIHMCQEDRAIGRNVNGCFAEYVAVPAENIFSLPDSIPDDVAAIFDPLGNAVYTAFSTEVTGEDVLITGAGPIGCMAAAICQKAGARSVTVTDVNSQRLALASKLGATYTVNVAEQPLEEAIKKLNLPNGFSSALEVSGAPSALNDAIRLLMPGSVMALLGILPPNAGIDWPGVIFKGITLKGLYGREIFSTWYKAAHLLEAGLDITPLITHHYPLDHYQEGFEAMISGGSGKVILEIAS
jgi:threonine 3-dehydrogenase